jgi:hypothetical protein
MSSTAPGASETEYDRFSRIFSEIHEIAQHAPVPRSPGPSPDALAISVIQRACREARPELHLGKRT